MLWGPSFFPRCVLFFHLSFPSAPPLHLFLLSLFLSLSLHSPVFVEVTLLAAWESVPYKLPTPAVRSVKAACPHSPALLPPNPPVPPFLPFSASIWCVHSEFGCSGRRRRSPGSFDCLGGLGMLFERWAGGGTDILLWTYAPLLQAVILVILWLLLAPPSQSQFPFL